LFVLTTRIGQVSERVVNQLLTEMDGLEARKQVFVIGATNRPDIIDPAMLRPGRLAMKLYVPLPDAAGRESIIRKHTRQTPLDPKVDLHEVAFDKRAEGYSGADLAELVRQATVIALRKAQAAYKEHLESDGKQSSGGIGADGKWSWADHGSLAIVVGYEHFQLAFDKVPPSVSPQSKAVYERMRDSLSQARAAGDAQPPSLDKAVVAAAPASSPSGSTKREKK
jgi:ribosome biogenesis ATPase